MKISLLAVLDRVDAYFMKRSPIHRAAQRIATTLSDMEIPFAIAGALAANAHGHVRTTDDVDILISAEGLSNFKAKFLGRGWVEKFEGSKGFRDAVENVDIDVLVAGEFPGDGRPKPVVFPNPAEVIELDVDGMPILSLPKLLELKLASGMTAPDRFRDLDDVIQLIRANNLLLEFGDQLNPYVRDRYGELWLAAQHTDEF